MELKPRLRSSCKRRSLAEQIPPMQPCSTIAHCGVYFPRSRGRWYYDPVVDRLVCYADTIFLMVHRLYGGLSNQNTEQAIIQELVTWLLETFYPNVMASQPSSWFIRHLSPSVRCSNEELADFHISSLRFLNSEQHSSTCLKAFGSCPRGQSLDEYG